jgi:hypothetical protein
MNAGHFEQLSDCWSSEQQPATIIVQRRPKPEGSRQTPTTPRGKRYLDKMFAHCERLAGKVEPGTSPATIGRPKVFMIGPVVEIDKQELLISESECLPRVLQVRPPRAPFCQRR